MFFHKLILGEPERWQRWENRLVDRAPDWSCLRAQKSGNSLINMAVDQTSVKIQALLAGFNREQIRIALEGEKISIQADRQPKDESLTWMRQDIPTSFKREIPLPFAINKEKVKAKLEEGLLTLDLEMAEELKPKKIEISKD